MAPPSPAAFLATAVAIYVVAGANVAESVKIGNLTYVGCFDPSYALSQNEHHYIAAVSLEKCVMYCTGLNKRYAGVEKSDDFCYCGNALAEESSRRNDSLCNIPCETNGNRTCGGDWIMSLYELMIEPVADTSEPVGFLIGISSGVRLYNTSDMNNYKTAIATTDWAYTVDYHMAKNIAFVLTRRKLYKSPLKSEDYVPQTLVLEVSGCDGFAVDWVHDRIYWADCRMGVNNIMSMDLDGKNLSTVVKRPGEDGRGVKRMEVDPNNGKLFWIAEGVVEGCSLSGGEFRTNLSAAGVVVRALALDLATQTVYYTGSLNQSSALFSMDYLGGNLREVFSVPQMRSVYGLGLVKGFAYWVHYANSRDVIYKAPLRLGDSSEVQMLKTIDKAVWHMRVVHPDLQPRPQSDPCQLTGCSHICVTVSSTVAACQCPDGMVLGVDKVTCSRSQASGNLTYVGCFDPTYAIEHGYHQHIADITLEKCVKYCTVKRSKYAGIEKSDDFCYCGGDLAEASSRREDEYCPEPCSEGSDRRCGGDLLMSLYEIKGLKPPPADTATFTNSTGILLGMSGEVRVYRLDVEGQYKNSTVLPTNNWAYTVDYHFETRLVFTYSMGRLFKVSVSEDFQTKKGNVEMVSQMSLCPGFVVDWVKKRIYWANCNNDFSSIDSMSFNGENKTTITKRSGEARNIRRMEVDPYQERLFWVLDGVVEGCALSGGEIHANLSAPGVVVRSLALDLRAQRVYYAGSLNQSFYLFSMDYKGGDYRTHFSSSQLDSVFGLGLLDGQVYWVNYNSFKDVIYTKHLDDESPYVEAIIPVDKPVWHMRLLHPSLQERPLERLCEGGVECTSKLNSEDDMYVPGGVVLVAILVAAMLITAGSVYWGKDRLKMSLSGVPYASHRDRSSPETTYDRTDDNVNLIY